MNFMIVLMLVSSITSSFAQAPYYDDPTNRRLNDGDRRLLEMAHYAAEEGESDSSSVDKDDCCAECCENYCSCFIRFFLWCCGGK